MKIIRTVPWLILDNKANITIKNTFSKFELISSQAAFSNAASFKLNLTSLSIDSKWFCGNFMWVEILTANTWQYIVRGKTQEQKRNSFSTRKWIDIDEKSVFFVHKQWAKNKVMCVKLDWISVLAKIENYFQSRSRNGAGMVVKKLVSWTSQKKFCYDFGQCNVKRNLLRLVKIRKKPLQWSSFHSRSYNLSCFKLSKVRTFTLKMLVSLQNEKYGGFL